MDKKLPARPNLEHLRRQAKTLLTQLNQGDLSAVQTFIDHLPAANRMDFEQVRQAGFRLADAQSAVARKTGFSTWPSLAHHVEQLRAFEGTWAFVDLEVDGMTIPAEALVNSRMLMDGDRFRMESPEGNFEGIFTIDVEQSPHHLDIEFVEGPEAGNWAYGIYELSGDSLKICLGLVGASRPETFATAPGSGHALENLRRVSKERPEGVEGGVPQPVRETPKGDPADFDVPMTPLMEKLQGDWEAVELVKDGQALPDHMLKMGSRIGTGNETKVIFGGQVIVHAKVRLDESVSPIAVDYLSIGNGDISLGVMDFVGEDVRFCMAPSGEPRPGGFVCEPGSGLILSRWRRKPNERP